MKKALLNTEKCRQNKPYTCGPASLKILLDFFGKKIPQNRLSILCKANSKDGTSPRNMIKTTKKFGFKITQKFNAKIKDIENYLKKGFPVMVAYQAWGGGHYSIIRGFNQKYFNFSDPAIDRGYRNINKKLFYKRWHDVDLHGKPYSRWLMVLKKK